MGQISKHLVLGLAVQLFAVAAFAAANVFVDPVDPTCSGMGTTGVDCFTTIQAAVDNAGPAPAVVQVAAGAYVESVDISAMGSAIAGVPGDIEIIGAGSATTLVTPPVGRAFWNSVAPYPGSIRIKGFDVTDSGPIGGIISATDDAASSWSVANVGMGDVQVLVVDPSNSQILYAGTRSSGVFKSVDGGATWTASNTGLPMPLPEVTALAIDPQVAATLYLGSVLDGQRMFKSTNGGASWTLMETGLESGRVNSIAVDPSNSLRVFAGLGRFDSSPRGVFRSLNGGGMWTEVDPDDSIAIAIAPSTPTTIYSAGVGLQKSTNGGDTWVPANGDLPSTLFQFPFIAIDPTDANSVVVARSQCCGQRAFSTADGGGTWTELIVPNYQDDDVFALIMDPTTPATLYLSTSFGGVLKSIDAGASWSPANDGMLRKKSLRLAMAASNPDVLYTAASGVGFDAINLDDLLGDATIDDVFAHDASFDGVDVQSRGLVTIRDSESRNNQNDGFEIIAGAGLSVLSSSAEDNDAVLPGNTSFGNDGVEIDVVAGTVTIIDSSSNRNGQDGFEVHALRPQEVHYPVYAPRPEVGAIDSLAAIRSRASGNGLAGPGDGFQIEGQEDSSVGLCASVGPIDLRQITVEDNSEDGIEFEYLSGDVSLIDVRAVRNLFDGVELDAQNSPCSDDGVDVTVRGLYAEGNGKSLGGNGDGLEVDTNGDIDVRDSVAIDNGDFQKTPTEEPGTPTRTPTNTFLPGTPSPTPRTGGGDGFELDSKKFKAVVVCDGCRAIDNKDDGIAIESDGVAIVRNSTSEANFQDAVDFNDEFGLYRTRTPTRTFTPSQDPNAPTPTDTPTPDVTPTATPTNDGGEADQIIVSDSIVAGSGNDGIAFSSGGTTEVSRVCVTDNGRNGAIAFRADGPVTVTDSDVLRNGTVGICLFEAASDANSATSNNVAGNGDGMALNSPINVAAAGNWWGDVSGPSGLNGGAGDSVVDSLSGGGNGVIAFAPFEAAEIDTGGVCDPIPTPTATPTPPAPDGDVPPGGLPPGSTELCGEASPNLPDGCIQLCPPDSPLVSDCFGSSGTDGNGDFCIALETPLEVGEIVELRDICNDRSNALLAGSLTPSPAPAVDRLGLALAACILTVIAGVALARRRRWETR